MSFEGSTEIVEGLKTGQTIVDKGFRELTEGTIVRIHEAKDESLAAKE